MPARQRGLAPALAVVLALALSLLGAGFDLLGGRTLGIGFAVCFVVGCLAAACAVQRRSLKTVLFAPPLLYAGVALGVGLLRGTVPAHRLASGRRAADRAGARRARAARARCRSSVLVALLRAAQR